MASVPASEFQKNFGQWHDRIYEGPVEITRYGRPTAYLVSARMFQEMWQRYRLSVPVEDLSDADLALIEKARVEGDHPYNLDDIPDGAEDVPLRPAKP